MNYPGSKRRIAKHILPIILKNRKKGQWYIEPFVGGGNLIDKVNGNRIGYDINPYVIEALKLIRDDPYSIPDLITEDMYRELKEKKELNGITGFVGITMSFGARFFRGYGRITAGARNCIKNMETRTRRAKQSAIKQSEGLKGVILAQCSYSDIVFPSNSLIYCDPPYKNTMRYSHDIDHDHFFNWCRELSRQGHSVYISEYSAPPDFTCVWSMELSTGLMAHTAKKIVVEKLFTIT